MGAWGSESCSNDSVWDCLVAEDIHQMTQTEANVTLRETWKHRWVTPFEKLGVVVWLLTHGLKVPKTKLKEVLPYIDEELKPKNLESWRDEEERKNCLLQERKEIEAALKAGGQGKERHVKGLMEKIGDFMEGR